MNVEIRPATDSDKAFSYEVTKATMHRYVEAAFGPWVESFQLDLIGKSFDTNTHSIVVVDGVRGGLVATRYHATHIQLEKLYLLPRFQRQGIGSRILQPLIDQSVNTDARRFYERHGFVVSSVTPERIHMEYHRR
jgi:GNAT superfamily N-acetyltransferase